MPRLNRYMKMILVKTTLNKLITVREKIESFYEEKTRGIIIRARARSHEYGEKSSKYFLNLEKRNHVKKTYAETEY